MLPVKIKETGDESIDGKVGSLVQFDFDSHNAMYYALVMVDGDFHTLPSESLTAMKPAEEEASNEVDPSQ